jgi:hypothetical protein
LTLLPLSLQLCISSLNSKNPFLKQILQQPLVN